MIGRSLWRREEGGNVIVRAGRPLRFWFALFASGLVIAFGTLLSFDYIPSGNGEVLDQDHVPNFVYVLLAILGWASVLGLVAVGVVALSRRRERRRPT